MPTAGRKPTTMSSIFNPREPRRHREQRLVELATRQHGVVSLAQFRLLGLTESTVRSRVTAGSLHRIHDGVFALGRPDLPRHGRWMAAVLACGEGALLSHRSAAALQELLAVGGGPIDVTVPNRSARSRPGIRTHRPVALDRPDRAVVEGIPCTSVPRTLLGLAAVVPLGVLETACNRAELLNVLDMAAMGELLERSRGHPGTRALRSVLRIDLGEGVPRTELERRFLALCRRAALPSPSVNAWISLAGEEMQFDFVWHRERVVVDVDGWDTHRTRRAFQEDRRRDRLLRLAGWEPLRFTWQDVGEQGAQVKAEVGSLLAERRLVGDLQIRRRGGGG
jgi:very-short-patch-repair endonuclease